MKLGQKIQLFSHSIFLRLSQINGLVGVVFVGIFVDSNRASDVISYGVGAGALVVGLAIFAFATKKNNGKIGSKK